MKLRYIGIQNAIKLHHVIFPLDQKILLDEFGKAGFQPAKKGQIISNTLVIQGGDIAVKNNTVVSLFPDSMTVQITGLSSTEVMQTTKEAESIFTKAGLDFKKEFFRELTIGCFVDSGKNPTKSVQRFLGPLKRKESFEKILGDKPPAHFMIRLLPKDAVVDTEDFYDVKVEPSLRNPTKEYYFSMNIRSKKIEDMEKFLLTLDTKVEAMISAVEASD